MTRTRSLRGDGRGISAVYDALLALVIIMVAMGAVHQMIVSSLAVDSEKEASEDMERMANIALPLIMEATGHAFYGNMSNGTFIDLGLLRTRDMFEYGLVLLGLQADGAANYDIGGLREAIAANCRLVLWGWHWAIGVDGVKGSDSRSWTGPGLFVGDSDIQDATGVPDPRSVNTMTVAGGDVLMEVRLYVWT